MRVVNHPHTKLHRCKGEKQDEQPGKPWKCYTTFIIHTADHGKSWQYRGRVEWDNSTALIEGPCEAEVTQLVDGRSRLSHGLLHSPPTVGGYVGGYVGGHVGECVK